MGILFLGSILKVLLHKIILATMYCQRSSIDQV